MTSTGVVAVAIVVAIGVFAVVVGKVLKWRAEYVEAMQEDAEDDDRT